MNYLKLKQKIYEAIERNPLDRSAYEEMFAVCREYEKIDFQTAHTWNHELRNHISWGLRMTVSCQKFDEAREFDDLMFRSLLFGAQHFFDDYLQAVEYGKPLDKKFYQPRRHYLRRYVDAYQEILDGKLDFLSISMPKRAGKSQLGINFTNMLSGKYPDRATLMEGTGDDLVKSFYLGCLEYLTLPSDYHFYDIFPESKLVQTNADTKIINLLHKSRFPTVMCRSIDARQVGLSEATNLLYLDDCVEGREEAKNRQRLDDKWEVISGDIIGRAIEGTPIVICGTRYSLYDPIGHLQEEMQKQGKRCKIIETPALDPVTDESNFEYMREGRKVFTTQYFRDQREMLSEEQFESEFQQQPFEAKGILFPEKSLNRYFELPIDRDPDSIIAVCDTADTGDDFCAMPIAAVYGSEVYIVDVVFDDSVGKVKISASTPKRISEIGNAMKSISQSDIDRMESMSRALQGMQGLQNVRIPQVNTGGTGSGTPNPADINSEPASSGRSTSHSGTQTEDVGNTGGADNGMSHADSQLQEVTRSAGVARTALSGVKKVIGEIGGLNRKHTAKSEFQNQ